MIVYFLRALTEYISIVLCLYKAADKKIVIKASSFVCLCIYMILLYLSVNNNVLNILVYGYWAVYTRIKITDNIKKTLKSLGIMVIFIPIMQMILYAVFGNMFHRWIVNATGVGIVHICNNIIICIMILLWKKEYLYSLGKRLNKYNKFNNFAIFLLVIVTLVYLIYVFRNNVRITSPVFQQILVTISVCGLTIILLENAEMEKKHKAEELRMYEQYTSTFEDAITAIKMRQHEFDNHINAIKCMQYTIDDREELVREQQKYCDSILKENTFNKVLFLKVSPILSGYLYSKFTIAEKRGIQIAYEIEDMMDEKKVSMNDLIEVIGILFDNAVEELEARGKSNMFVKIYYGNNTWLTVEVANESDKIPNTEMEKFFMRGYSTKGESRGMGLCRLNELVRKYRADLNAENIEMNQVNYLRFRVAFGKNKMGSH